MQNDADNTSSSTTLESTSTTVASSSSTPVIPTPLPTDQQGFLINYEIEPYAKIATLKVDCEKLESRYQVTTEGEKFSVYCHNDIHEGDQRNVYNDKITLVTVSSLIAYSMADCLEACSQYTRNSARAGVDSSCGTVTWLSELKKSGQKGGNCYLKNSTVMFDQDRSVRDDWAHSATKIA